MPAARTAPRAALAALWLLVGACSAIFGVDVPEQTVTAACGLCVFHDPDAKGCYWAVELDGAYYAVNGDTPADHEPHAPGGMCTMPRKAVVAGELRGKQLFASKFELLPVDPASLPAADALPAHQH